MTESKDLRMKNPDHPERFIRTVVIEPMGLSVTKAARTLGITRGALSRFLNEQASLSPEMAFRLDKAFGATWKPSCACRAATTSSRRGSGRGKINVARFQKTPGRDPQPGFPEGAS